MNHNEIQELIHAYIDGELDVVNARAVQKHLGECHECRRVERRLGDLSMVLKNSAAAYRAPNQLRKDLNATLRREAKTTAVSFWLPVAVGAFAALLLAFAVLQTRHSAGDKIADDLVANHVRSLLATHLVDVASSDQHTVKPWFDGKVDFAPEVRDLSADGFPLVGGRLDYLNGRTVVALVYNRQKHSINLFVLPASSDSVVGASTITRRGYNLVHWTRGGMEYWAVSDLNAAELREFAGHFTR